MRRGRRLEKIAGYPHRMRFKAFNARYRLIAPFKQLRRAEEQAVEDTKLILQNAQQLKSKFGASTSWALGKRHIFLSEGIRQQLENLRSETRRKAATVIQVMRFFAAPLSFNYQRNVNKILSAISCLVFFVHLKEVCCLISSEFLKVFDPFPLFKCFPIEVFHLELLQQ